MGHSYLKSTHKRRTPMLEKKYCGLVKRNAISDTLQLSIFMEIEMRYIGISKNNAH